MRGLMSAWRRGGRRGKALALAALMVWLSESTASGDAGPETDNALAILCGIVEFFGDGRGAAGRLFHSPHLA